MILTSFRCSKCQYITGSRGNVVACYYSEVVSCCKCKSINNLCVALIDNRCVVSAGDRWSGYAVREIIATESIFNGIEFL